MAFRTLLYLLMLHLAGSGFCAGDLKDVVRFVRHYELLSYDRLSVLEQHERVKRHVPPQTPLLQLDFQAYQRVFNLRLQQDVDGFADDFKLLSGNDSGPGDLSHIYSGVLEGETGSSCHGSIVDGQFEGSIRTTNGTFYVESVHNGTEPAHQHSVIYHEDEIDETDLGSGRVGVCGADRLENIIRNLRQEPPVSRSRRTVDRSKTSCLLHLHADQLFYQRFGSVQAVIAQVASYVKAVNDIYDKADFDGIDVVNFKVKSISYVTEEDPSDPLQETFIGPEKLLTLYSESNWNDFCLSYLLTNRDFSGVLGLAWEGRTDDLGGICSRHTRLKDGRSSSLNTGLVTLQNFGHYLPPKFVQLTLAHELGHSLGSRHDEGPDCGGLDITGGNGRFLMFPQATDELKPNSDRFSPCSLQRISRLLQNKKDRCFVVSEQPICGNQVLEKGEECDVGHNESDPCCYSSKEAEGVQCRLKPNTHCSPSQGPCCSSSCVFKNSEQTCEEDSECRMKSVCTGNSASCPKPPPKPDMTVCRLGTRVCLNGECSHSLCVIYDLEQCDCPGENKKDKCHMCCQQKGNPNTCASTTSSLLSSYFKGQRVALVPGTPCSHNQGYCDHFQTCRLLDADGPLARLKNSFLHLDEFHDLAEWMKPSVKEQWAAEVQVLGDGTLLMTARWWVILMGIFTVSAVMAATAYMFGRTLDTLDDSN